jgi:hypothetical protein
MMLQEVLVFFNIVLKSAATGLTGNLRTSVGYAEFIKTTNGLNLYNNTENGI